MKNANQQVHINKFFNNNDMLLFIYKKIPFYH
jgi:hypothetical protein